MAYDTVTQHHKLYPFTSIMAGPYSCDPTGATDCAAAIEQIKTNQSNVGTIYVPHGTFLINTNLTIPAGMALMFEDGGSFSVAAGKTLTVNGTIQAGPFQIFSGAGTITIATAKNKLIHGEWTGSTGLSSSSAVTLSNLAGAGGFVKNSAAGLLSGNNTIGVGDVADASTTVKGIAELATDAECQAGADTTRIVTPAGLASVTATETRAGLVERATDAEAVAMVDTSRYITPAHLALLGSTSLVQVVYTIYNTYTNTVAVIPYDDTIPQITEGTEFFTVGITPTSATNILILEASLWAFAAGGIYATMALFQDATANALSATNTLVASGYDTRLLLKHVMVSGTTAATTFRIRGGVHANTMYINGTSTGRKLGGILTSYIIITEITP